MFRLYQFKRMPFGIKKGGTLYCYLVAKIMQDLRLQLVVHYLDNILIHTSGMDDHAGGLEAVLEAPQQREKVSCRK